MENIVFKNVSKENISEIVKMRMSYKDRISVFFYEIPSKCLIEDYFYFYLENYPDGFWIVFEKDVIIGYIIITELGERNWHKVILKGYLFKWLFNWLSGNYGISLKSVIKSVLRVFYSNSIKAKHDNKISDKICYIASIGVKSDLRGKGIGSKILQFAFEYARQKGYNEICLKVGKDNIPAIMLFKKAGFTIDYDKNNFLLMSCSIKNEQFRR